MQYYINNSVSKFIPTLRLTYIFFDATRKMKAVVTILGAAN